MSFSLLEFEQNRAARTTVIDDQSDYFDSSAHWLTDEQRQEAAAKEKAFMERVDRRRRDIPVEFSIDIAGRCIYGVADTPLFPEGSNSGSDAPVTPNVGDGETGSGSSTERFLRNVHPRSHRRSFPPVQRAGFMSQLRTLEATASPQSALWHDVMVREFSGLCDENTFDIG